MSGVTNSTSYPTASPLDSELGGIQDAVVTKLDPSDSNLVYSTYLGGSGDEVATSVTIDASGNAYVSGSTSSDDFPTMNPLQRAFGGGSQDAFVAKLNAAGSALVYSTYLGGTDDDFSNAIAVDLSGNASTVGFTFSTNLPISNPVQADFGGGASDAFLSVLNTAGSEFVFSTYLGGTDFESVGGLVVDNSGNAYLIGQTLSTDFPTSTPIQATNSGSVETFVVKIDLGDLTSVQENHAGMPAVFNLEQNYPNPFNPSTTIRFALPEAGSVTLQVYTLTGQLVRQLANGKYANGRHEVVWDGRDHRGVAMASGIYFYRLEVHKQNGDAPFTETHKMVLVK